MSLLALGIGLVLAIEGLVLALAPRRVEDALRILASFAPDQRRLIGLGSLAIGVLCIWLFRTQ